MPRRVLKERPWALIEGGIYSFLMHILPDHRSPQQKLDVLRLAEDLNRSHEAIYKWLRKGRLKPENAMALFTLANGDENRAALAAVGREPPTLRDFDPYVYRAA